MGRIPPAAADFDRPLLLTPRENMAGWLASRLGRALCLLITCVSVAAVLLIFFFVIKEAIGFILARGVAEFFTSTRWYPEDLHAPEFGGLALMAGSGYVTAVALAVAVPVGVSAAVFLSDIVPFKVRQIVKPVIELLAAIPSVAFGAFAALVVAPWLQNTLHLSTGNNIVNAGLLLALMAVPTIVSVSEDSLTAVGRELREGSYALGATRAETVFKVVIPAGRSGIVAAVILGMMRAVGETMVVWMASGNAVQVPHPWWDLTQSVRTMTATVAAEMGDTAQGQVHFQSLFFIGVVLLVFTFLLNSASEYYMHRAKRTATGGKP